MRNLILGMLVAGMMTSTAMAQDYGKQTVTGTVVTAAHDSLVLDTATGQMTFKLDSMLDRVRYDGLQPGARVEVTHKADDQGLRQVVTDVTMLQNPNGTAADATLYKNNTTNNVAPDRTAAGDRYASADANRDDRNHLPSTASPFGALALLSVAAIFAGMGLREYAKGTRFGR